MSLLVWVFRQVETQAPEGLLAMKCQKLAPMVVNRQNSGMSVVYLAVKALDWTLSVIRAWCLQRLEALVDPEGLASLHAGLVRTLSRYFSPRPNLLGRHSIL